MKRVTAYHCNLRSQAEEYRRKLLAQYPSSNPTVSGGPGGWKVRLDEGHLKRACISSQRF